MDAQVQDGSPPLLPPLWSLSPFRDISDAQSQDLRAEKPRRGNKLPRQRVWPGPGERTAERGWWTCHRKGRSDRQRQPLGRSANEVPAKSIAERTDSFRIGPPPDRYNQGAAACSWLS